MQQFLLRKGQALRFYFVIDCTNSLPGVFDVFFDHEVLSGDQFPWKGHVEVTDEKSQPEGLGCNLMVSDKIGGTKVDKMGILTIIRSGETTPMLRKSLPPVSFSSDSKRIDGIGVYIRIGADEATVSGVRPYWT